MSKEILAALSAPFAPHQVKERVGAGGMKLRWVDARTISQRLDEVLGVSAWDFTAHTEADGVVAGKLTIRLADGTTAVRQDFGYPTGGSGEPVKEATSDALRRCASLFGVARYLYQDAGTQAFVAAHQPRPVVQPVMVAPGEHPAPHPSNDPQLLKAAMNLFGNLKGGICPIHGEAWKLKPAGISKATNKPYNAFYSCGVKDNQGFCKAKPSDTPDGKEWLKAQQGESAPASDEGSLEQLPF
jgi:hypothetical protein